MPDNKTVKTNSWEMERERFSSFVVDLRQLAAEKASQTAHEVRQAATKEELKASRRLKKDWKRWEGSLGDKAKKLRPDLLKREIKKVMKETRPQGRVLSVRLFSGFSFGGKVLSRSKRRPAWKKIIAQKQRSFRVPLRVGRRPRPDQEERLKTANEKVVWYRSLLSFIGILLLIITPLKLLSYFELLDFQGFEDKIVGRSRLAFNNILAAADSVSRQDFQGASQDFQKAGADFLAAQEELNKINDSILALGSLSSDPKLKLAAESKKFLTAGALASSLGQNLVLATDSLFNGDKGSFSATLDSFSHYGRLAVSDARKLEAALNKIEPDNLPEQYRAKFISLDKQVSLLADNLDSFVSASEKLKNILGSTRDRRYLLVFQNNAELRASGGFLGSYALVDLRDGQIRNLEVPGGGSYDTEAGLKHLVVAPRPLWLVNPLWHFWDANWWPDWPTTAKNLMWFYERSDGPSVDGVISVTPTVIERLLEITGPIDLTKEYGLVISADNFWETVQKIVEQKNLAKTDPMAIAELAATLDKAASTAPIKTAVPLEQDLENNAGNKPKKIIGDLLAKILEVLPQKLNKDNLVKILAAFETSMSEKQILLYFQDPSLQEMASGHNWAGEIKATDRDYLLVVDTNIAGQKSDRKMTEKIEHLSVVSPDGSIINTVTISRTHTGLKNEPLVGVRNVDWLRVYVPRGSKLLAAEGFRTPEDKYMQEKPEADWEKDPLLANEEAAVEGPGGAKVYIENDKTVFANWVMTDPGETSVITLQYRLPFNMFSRPATAGSWLERLNELLNPDSDSLRPYSLLLQKQPGAKNANFSSRLVLPAGWHIFWRYPETLLGDTSWEISAPLAADSYTSVLLEEK